MSTAPPWRPTAVPGMLRLRAHLFAQVRAYFAARGVLEVDTPALVHHAVTDRHLHSAEVRLPGEPGLLYLHTSPEYAMKRLLAAGSGDIYQLAHVFRGDEASPLHNAEFTLLEWYRCGFTLAQLMAEVAQLAAQLLDLPAGGAVETLGYAAAFERLLGIDPLADPLSRLCEGAVAAGLDAPLAAALSRDELLDWLVATRVGPALGADGLCFLTGYPASQAALARLDPADERVALRFELYYRGVELANGFEELADAGEQRLRFERDRTARRAAGLPVPESDVWLLAALAAGLPAVAGVALGLDRVLMLRAGAGHIDAVLPFPLARA